MNLLSSRFVPSFASALVFLATTAISGTASAAEQFPSSPDPAMTPGSLCAKSSELRYPERIAYCNRNVDSAQKREVMVAYDEELGYRVTQMNRAEFKIDHYIPLCMGGSNDDTNLWPQHRSVYEVTDPLEPVACDKMAKGKLKQADAVSLLKRAKTDLSAAPAILEQLERL